MEYGSPRFGALSNCRNDLLSQTHTYTHAHTHTRTHTHTHTHIHTERHADAQAHTKPRPRRPRFQVCTLDFVRERQRPNHEEGKKSCKKRGGQKANSVKEKEQERAYASEDVLSSSYGKRAKLIHMHFRDKDRQTDRQTHLRRCSSISIMQARFLQR